MTLMMLGTFVHSTQGCVRLNFEPGTKLVLAGTIQFSSAVQVMAELPASI